MDIFLFPFMIFLSLLPCMFPPIVDDFLALLSEDMLIYTYLNSLSCGMQKIFKKRYHLRYSKIYEEKGKGFGIEGGKGIDNRQV